MIESVMKYLGLRGAPDWIDATAFDSIVGPTGALRRARESMSVCGAFGTWQYGTSDIGVKRFVPLLYIASAKDDVDARDNVHRRVWSQGIVPILIICTPTTVFISEGFTFSQKKWDHQIKRISAEVIQNSAHTKIEDLDRLKPHRLLSSVAWRDFSINPTSRVDQRLLSTLEALSERISSQGQSDVRSINALIGRFLYFYILRDRGYLTNAWLGQFCQPDIFECRSQNLTTDIVWVVFDELDRLLNGSIFPLAKKQRKNFLNTDVQLLRDSIKLGDVLHKDGAQLSFFDFDISNIQTETLSAIYEKFLETEDNELKRREGAFYTPPYLADFVLDRIDDSIPLTKELRIIDCTAGSGVFIVGAYRRIIENNLLRRRLSVLPAADLRNLLESSIFAIEKNPSALSIAAFSLYLTMLDYVDPADVEQCLHGDARARLFPQLEKNLICADTFNISSLPKSWNNSFDIVIGNPPWQNIQKITDKFVKLDTAIKKRIDSLEAAEYTVWWSARHLAKTTGIIAQVIPTKSLIGPSSNRFPKAITRELTILGVVNLSHFRYKLFAHARQAACVIFIRNEKPISGSTTWFYSPNRAHMVSSRKAEPWVLSLDHSLIETVLQNDLSDNCDAWFEMMMLKPFDRYIRRYLFDWIAVGKLNSLKRLFMNEEIKIDRGGSPVQTGLDPQLLFGANKLHTNYILNAQGVTRLDEDNQNSLFPTGDPIYTRQPIWTKYVTSKFKSRFSANTLLIPRSMQWTAYAYQPVAFNSSINVLYFSNYQQDPITLTKRKQLLIAIGLYLQSEVGKYFMALTGKLWILDRTRLEKNDLLSMPIPFNGVDDPFIDTFLNSSLDNRTEVVCRKLGLSDLAISAVREYATFRKSFEDGGVSQQFETKPSMQELNMYKTALSFSVQSIFTPGQKPCIKIHQQKGRDSWFLVSIAIDKEQANMSFAPPSSGSLSYGISDFNESTSITIDKHPVAIWIRKPAERFRWTTDSGFTDGSLVIKKLMDVAHER